MTEPLSFEQEMRLRLDQMERKLRRWQRGSVVVVGFVVLTFASAMAAPPTKELVANALKIVDLAGKERIVLTADPEKADLTFFDPSGKSRLTLDVAKDRRPVLIFANESGNESTRLVLGLEDEGNPGLTLYDNKGRKRVAFGIPKEGGPVIRILDENGKLRMRFP